MSAGGGRRRRFVAVALTLVALSGFLVLARQTWFESLERALTGDRIAVDPRTRSRFRTVLRRAGALHVQRPTDFLREESTGADRRCPDPMFGPEPVAASEMPSSWLAPPEFLFPARGGLSLAIEPCRLRRLSESRRQRGRNWEELGWISIYRDGQLRFATPIGVRIHGRYRRRWPTPSFRIYFRGGFGEPALPPEILHPDLEAAPRRLAVKWTPTDTNGRSWPFSESVALDIGRRLGALAPHARPLSLSLNGGAPTPYHLVERIDDDFVLSHFGHADFEIARSKAGELEISRQIHWLATQPSPLDERTVAARFDTRQLVASLLTAAYCGVADSFQDAMLKDRRGVLAGGRWTWALWDVEGAFKTFFSPETTPGYRDVLPRLFGRGQPRNFLPERLLRRLLQEDPDFRRAVGLRFVEALNHDLSPEFIRELLDRYRPIAAEMGRPNDPFLLELEPRFEQRHAALRRQLETHFGLGPWYTLDVRAPSGALLVDGREIASPRRFHYPAGTEVRLSIPGRLRPRFAGWAGGRRPAAPLAPELSLTIDSASAIEAIFRP